MTESEIKTAIDTHVVKYKRYYSSICISYFNGRYLWEDMFQELYIHFLKVRPEQIIKFHSQNKLHFLGGKILWFLYSKRGHRKNHVDSQTSTLNESANRIEYRFFDNMDDEENATETIGFDLIDEPTDPLSKIAPTDIDTALNDLYSHDPFLFDVFTILQKETINSLSKKADINRKFLTDSHKKACEFIRNHKQLSKF